jgi:hypothetical protein
MERSKKRCILKGPDKPARYPKHTKKINKYLKLQNKYSFAISSNCGRIKLEVCYNL